MSQSRCSFVGNQEISVDDFVAWIDKSPALIGCQVLMGVIFLIMVNVRLIIFP